jgi:hypothetical protein
VLAMAYFRVTIWQMPLPLDMCKGSSFRGFRKIHG